VRLVAPALVALLAGAAAVALTAWCPCPWRSSSSEPSATRARQSWNPRPLPPPTGAALVFAGVSLWYPDSTRPALVGFDLCVRVGEKVAFTGRSGRNRHTRVQPPAE
jgi:ABC-type multidrug transport system fused ATPase/permease subunit